MFDKMHLRSGTISEDALLQMGALKCPGDGQYRKIYRLNLGGVKFITIRMQPYYASALPSIEFNPSKFDSWKEILEMLTHFASVDELRIDRLDYATDIQKPFMDAWKCIRVVRKKSTDIWERMTAKKRIHVTGFRTGEKPEVFCIYDKGYEVTKKWKFKKIPGAKFGDCTRFEVRHFNQKVPFTSLSEISKYLDYNPFEKIEYWVLKPNAEEEERVKEFLPDLKAKGFDGFYAEKNASGNFQRTYSRYFMKHPLADELREDHYSSLRKFLVDQIKEQENIGV